MVKGQVTIPKDVRDVKERPILRAAKKAGADVLLIGDKDFF